jgi:hypothetical protein
MTTSSSYDYNQTALQIITEALQFINEYDAGRTISSSDVATCLTTLNGRIKMLQAKGIGLWKTREAALFPQEDEYSYDIGPSGDNCSTVWYKTELSAAGVATDATITVDSDDNITDGDYIGIELDDGTVQWTTVNGTPAANVVTLTAALTGAAAIDNHVYNYTSKVQRPLEITEARLRNADGKDRPLSIKSRDEYMLLSDKTSTGPANIVYYDPQMTNGKLYVQPACSDVQEYIVFSCRIPIEDFDSQSNDPDFPQEWLLPLANDLAVLIAPKYGRQLSPEFIATAREMLKDVSDFDREQASVFFSITS